MRQAALRLPDPDLPQPGLCLPQALRQEAVDAHGALLPAAQQATGLEDSEVMEHCRRPKGKDLPELDQTHVATPQGLEVPAARRIRECAEGGTETVFQHALKYEAEREGFNYA